MASKPCTRYDLEWTLRLWCAQAIWETDPCLRAGIEAGDVPLTLLCNGWYTENYADQIGQYLAAGEILGAAGNGRISTASRQDCAAAAATALLDDDAGNRTYELGGPAFDLRRARADHHRGHLHKGDPP
jgi:uncharacterized protein YbjT (DUF2867 family)